MTAILGYARVSTTGQGVPSGLNATADTGPVWPVSGSPTGFPVAASHSRTVWSAPPEAMRVAVGTGAGCLMELHDGV